MSRPATPSPPARRPSPARRAAAFFRRHYGRSPLHLLGHLALIAVTAWVLSVMFEPVFAPQPWNLVLWLLGGAVLHDGVFLPAWGVVNALVARVLGASDNRPITASLAGPPAGTEPGLAAIPTSRDQQRRVPIVNHVRVPVLTSAVLFLVFLPRILDRQPQNFVNALGHAPPDFFARWVWVTLGLIIASAALYGVRWLRATTRAGAIVADDGSVAG